MNKKFFKKLLGHKHENRYAWGEFYWGGKDLGIEYNQGYHSHSSLIIRLPFLFKAYINIGKEREPEWDDEEWGYGFYVYTWSEDVVFNWGKHRYRFEFPWMFKWQSTEILDFDRKVLHAITNKDNQVYLNGGKFEQGENIKKTIAKSYDYVYKLKDGSTQNRIATIKCIERRTWGRKWFPWKRCIETSIHIKFNEEVGEESGSWKGGCIGCNYDILPEETPEQCLRRMERERKF